MRTIDDVLHEAAEGLKAEGARTMHDSGWHPPKRPALGHGIAMAVLVAVATLAVVGIPALLTDTDPNNQNAAAGHTETSDDLGDASLDTPTLPEEARLLVESNVPGFGVVKLSTARDTISRGAETCIYTSSVDARVGSVLCGETMSGNDLGIYPVEYCSPQDGLSAAIIALMGLPGDDPEVTVTFNDDTQDVFQADSGAAVWAWNNTKSLIQIEIDGITSDQIDAVVQLPIGPCSSNADD